MHLAAESSAALEFDKIRALIADRCVSLLGREEASALSPVAEISEIEARQRPVVEVVDLIRFDDPLSIRSLPDIRRSLQTSSVPGSSLGVRELLDVGEILRAAQTLATYLSNRADKYPALCSVTDGLSSVPGALEESLGRSLDPPTETVKDSASPELRRIRRAIESTRDGIRSQVDAVLSRLPDDVVQDRLVTLRGGRFVIPVRENQRHRLKGMVHDQSSSGATLFIEPMATVELNNKLRQLELSEDQEVKRILQALTSQVAESADLLADDLAILCHFDAVYAQGSFCRDLDCSPPEFNEEGRVSLQGARHPLLVRRTLEDAEAEGVVPLDLDLGVDSWTLVLTGPNAGGKTVALKTVGILAIMAQSGLPIPAQPRSELPVFSGVFADIGDAQSIENDLSTFSSHVRNLVRICRDADSRALVLLDEVGASTDPDQGAALAMALLKRLTETGCRSIATTHHGALKAFAHATPGVMNGSMAFDAETLRPTYQLRLKVPGSSYAFEIARRLDMPEDVVEEARRIAGSDVGRVESLVAELDETYQAYQEELDQALSDRREMETLRDDYEARVKEVELRERDLKRGAQQEARRILKEANATVERTVREIRERGADSAAIRQAHERLRSAREEVETALATPDEPQSSADLQAGDRVWAQSFDRDGTIVEVRGGSGRALVEMGKVRVEISLEDLEPRGQADRPPDEKTRGDLVKAREVPTEVDLRGLTSDEAVDAADKYLDDLYLARIENATIIHGKGTGALRKAVGQFLKRHSLVKSQRLGGMSEGGAGVTVVTLDTKR